MSSGKQTWRRGLMVAAIVGTSCFAVTFGFLLKLRSILPHVSDVSLTLDNITESLQFSGVIGFFASAATLIVYLLKWIRPPVSKQQGCGFPLDKGAFERNGNQ